MEKGLKQALPVRTRRAGRRPLSRPKSTRGIAQDAGNPELIVEMGPCRETGGTYVAEHVTWFTRCRLEASLEACRCPYRVVMLFGWRTSTRFP